VSTSNPDQAQWANLIAREWSDPSFRSRFDADPAAILLAYGIQSVQGHAVSQLAGKIKVTEQSTSWSQKTSFNEGVLTIPFLSPAKSYA
jgi:hypothetical protein